MLPLKGPMPAPAQPDPANSDSGATVADKLTGGRSLSQEQPKAETVGAVITGGSSAQAEQAPMKGFEQKPGRSGRV